MNTPLYNSLNRIIEKNTLRLHMPGHKGKAVFKPFDEIFAYDFTETPETGNLYEETGAIREAEKLAAGYYGSADCHFLTGGSTQGIHAALGSVCDINGSVLIDRCCHKSVVSACALFDLKTYFVYPNIVKNYGFSGKLSLDDIENALKSNRDIKAFITVSPNYYGIIQDIKSISELCHKYGVKLIVDAAHSAHFKAIGFKTPIELGADIAILSGHKTLPVMGQGAYIIMKETNNRLRQFESMVCTSSPSYPIMLSLDLARDWAENTNDYILCVERTNNLRAFINQNTAFTALDESICFELDKCRLTINTSCADISGHDLCERLDRDFGIVCEMSDDRNIVCIMTAQDTQDDFSRLKKALADCSNGLNKTNIDENDITIPKARQVMSVRQAWFSKYKEIHIKEAEGKICSRPITPYPPGVPVVFSGEEITAKHIEFITKRCYNTISKVLVCD